MRETLLAERAAKFRDILFINGTPGDTLNLCSG
jgi:hypothetical protein